MAEQIDEKSIVNLSSFKLTDAHRSVLRRGLKFCPTPDSPNPGQLREDLDRIHKRIRQIAFFDNPENNLHHPNQSLDGAPPTPPAGDSDRFSLTPFKNRNFKLKAGGKGPLGPQNLESMILCNEHDFSTRPTYKHCHRSNLSNDERKSIKDLSQNKTIILRPADKGSAVVVWDRTDYLKEGYRQLSDNKFYKKLDFNPTNNFCKDISNFIEDMFQNGEIDQTVKDYLLAPVCRTPEFYLLPKIHK